jgi:drug/metabolite transporter (DMT)-like permease
VLGERLGALGWLGAALVAAGLVLAGRGETGEPGGRRGARGRAVLTGYVLRSDESP